MPHVEVSLTISGVTTYASVPEGFWERIIEAAQNGGKVPLYGQILPERGTE